MTKEESKKTPKWYERCIGNPAPIVPNLGLGGPTRDDLALAIVGTAHRNPYGFIAVTIEGMSAAVAVEVEAVERIDGEDRNDVFVIRGSIADAGVELPVKVVLNVERHTGTFEVLRKRASRRSVGAARGRRARE